MLVIIIVVFLGESQGRLRIDRMDSRAKGIVQVYSMTGFETSRMAGCSSRRREVVRLCPRTDGLLRLEQRFLDIHSSSITPGAQTLRRSTNHGHLEVCFSPSSCTESSTTSLCTKNAFKSFCDVRLLK